MIRLTSKAIRDIVCDCKGVKMADVRKENQAINGEVVLLRDSSDQANYTQTVGLIKDFSDSKPKLVDVEFTGKGDGQAEVAEIKENLPLNISNIDNLSLYDFVSRLREKRVRQLTNRHPKKAA